MSQYGLVFIEHKNKVNKHRKDVRRWVLCEK